MLENADLIFWVGHETEAFLDKPIETIGANAQSVELIDAHGLTKLGFREGGPFEKHSHDDHDDHDDEEMAEDDHHDDHGHEEMVEDGHHDDHGHEEMAEDEHHDEHDHGGVDGHIWLDPENAKAIVTDVVTELVEIDPENAAIYEANGETVRAELDELSGDIAARIAPVADKPYIVFHDAYQYFQSRFGTAALGSVTVSPEKQPGAARIAEIRQRLADENVVCVFREPQFSPRVIATIVEGTDVKVGVLDPLGAEIPAGPDQYPMLMTTLADDLVACLEGG
jgi:zinc transport system substrate-binding protein